MAYRWPVWVAGEDQRVMAIAGGAQGAGQKDDGREAGEGVNDWASTTQKAAPSRV